MKNVVGRGIQFLIFGVAHPLLIYPTFFIVYFLGFYRERMLTGSGILLWIGVALSLYILLVYLKYLRFRWMESSKYFTVDQFLRIHFKSQLPYILFLAVTWIFLTEAVGKSILIFILLFYIPMWVALGICSVFIFHNHFRDFF